ncbi:kelch-like protein 10 isoform X2 [Bradysia coprophila]|uniref:kelch-like protein 10 isoform X2 n=1 Tax=Bradysia coprophila TaxID=38358 RepID=UPI00187DA238|nr:kelch-like protein 10 isoform X2 [Bradysia coprophila]
MDDLNSGHSNESCMSKHSMQNLYEMRTNNMLCDGTITLDNDVVLSVHRPILCACSDYFKASFNSVINGVRSNIRITGVRYYAMTKIIDYAYLRECDLSEDNVYEILVMADYFALDSLLDHCIQFLISILSPKNCVNIMRFAAARNLVDNLLPKSKLYLLRNFEEVATKSDEIVDISLSDLQEILQDDLLNIKDECIAWECAVRWIKYDPEERKQHVPLLLQTVRLGILQTEYFMDKALSFLYELDEIGKREIEIHTPSIAIPRIPQDVIFVTGGWHQSQPVSKIQSYDCRADRWVFAPDDDPDGPLAYHGSAAVGHKIYIIGGFDGENYFNTCRVYDTLNRSWQEISPMHSRRCYVSVVELNGLIYAMGGFNGEIRMSSVERYDPATNQWSLIESMNYVRSDAHACVVNNKIYIIGGFTGQFCLQTAETYDPNTSKWTNIASMSVRRSGTACIGYNGFVYAIGGFDGHTRLSSCERYDPVNDAWTRILDMPHQRSNFAIEVLDDMIFAIGGYNGLYTLPQCECLDVAENQWYQVTELKMTLSGLKAVVIKELPNVSDFIYKNRINLIEERRRRMIITEFRQSVESRTTEI